MSDSNEVFKAKVEKAFYDFFRTHYRTDRLSSCEANRSILEKYCDENLLDASTATAIEIAFLAVGNQLVRTAEPVRPEPPSPLDVIETSEPESLSEQERLKQILRIEKDPKVVANQMRAILKAKDVESKIRHDAAHALPAEYTRQRLVKMHGAELRALQQRYGFAALDERLNSKETN